MSLNLIISNTLQPLGVPVEHINYSGNKKTYITFFEYNQMSALNADDEEKQTSYSIQVDIFSDGDYTDLVEQVKKEMKQAGFRRNFETELFEKETNYYHKVVRFIFIKNTEEE